MAVKAISEFTIQPGRRDAFVSLFESLVARHLESMGAAGCHSATIYVVVDDPDRAIEISEWESAEAQRGCCTARPWACSRLCSSWWPLPSATVVEQVH